MSEDFRTLYVDPGDETGWCVGRGFKLLAGGQEKLWTFADEVWYAFAQWSMMPKSDDYLPLPGSIFDNEANLVSGVTPEENAGPFGRIVCEDFRIYPKEAREGRLNWNPVRTARLIGALTWFAHHHNLEFELQPASIKEFAKAAGAEELYVKPHHENRHQNDAIQHFVYFTNTKLRGIKVPVPNQGVENT